MPGVSRSMRGKSRNGGMVRMTQIIGISPRQISIQKFHRI